MNLEHELKKRSNQTCELCGSIHNLLVYEVPQTKEVGLKTAIYACKICVSQIEKPETADVNHWRCLNDCMWSEHDAVKVIAWRMLNRLKPEGWPQDLLDMMYLEDDVLEFAKATGEDKDESNAAKHRDVNGAILEAGDSVVLIKDLKVKGSSMIAKQGTAVRNIRLDSDNPEYIEGKVDGQQIVIITQYVKRL